VRVVETEDDGPGRGDLGDLRKDAGKGYGRELLRAANMLVVYGPWTDATRSHRGVEVVTSHSASEDMHLALLDAYVVRL
jgi:hypothetical protein